MIKQRAGARKGRFSRSTGCGLLFRPRHRSRILSACPSRSPGIQGITKMAAFTTGGTCQTQRSKLDNKGCARRLLSRETIHKGQAANSCQPIQQDFILTLGCEPCSQTRRLESIEPTPAR